MNTFRLSLIPTPVLAASFALLASRSSPVHQRTRPRTPGALRTLSLVLAVAMAGSAIGADENGLSLPDDAYARFFDALLPRQLTGDVQAGSAAAGATAARAAPAGAVVAVVRAGRLAFARGYGHADKEGGRPVDPDTTQFFLGSVGKLFTWTAVMQLYERGKLDLHADVNGYLDFCIPEAFGEPITLHQLMTHTAGFEDDARSLFVADEASRLPLREHLESRMPARVYRPGAVTAYSNYGAALAGYIVERVSGQSYESYIEEHILEPLGMDASFAGGVPPGRFADTMARGYGPASPRGAVFEWPAAIPVAPVRATAADMAAFMAAHLEAPSGTDIMVSARSASLMQSMHFVKAGDTAGMAYGFLRMRINGQTVLWHLGRSPGFTTMLALLPERELGIFVSYNGPVPDEGRAALFGFLDEFYPVRHEPFDPEPLARWRERARAYSGHYAPARSNHSGGQKALNYFITVPLRIEDGRLSFNGRDFAESEPGFFRQIDGDRVLSLETDEGGRSWLVSGVLAYYRIPWYETPALLLSLVALTLALCIVSMLGRPRRASSRTPPSLCTALFVNGPGLYTIVMLALMAAMLQGFSRGFVYPADAMALASIILRLSIPWTLAAVTIVAEAWLCGRWTLYWRIVFSLQAAVACVMLLPFFAMRLT